MKNYPQISVLVAARNEEHNILNLLKSLDRLSYPKNRIQIIIGNDSSTDKTQEIIEEFIKGKDNFMLVNILGQVDNLKGKTNVLAQLASYAIGKYLFFTDADIEVSETWIEGMLKVANDKTGIVVGTTLVKYKNWFEGCQSIEWLFVLKMMDFLGKKKIQSTAIGNNMAVLTEAYKSTGGYSKIGFSIIEDYALYKAVIRNGFDFEHIFDKNILALTNPPQNYFEQRKRWLKGALDSKSILLLPGFLQALAVPILILVGFFAPMAVVYFYCFNLIANLIIGYLTFKEIGQMPLMKYIPHYTAYMYVFCFFQFAYYFLSPNTKWKGRNY